MTNSFDDLSRAELEKMLAAGAEIETCNRVLHKVEANVVSEVLKDQGVALPFTKGFYLICSLVAAFNPDDLDAMDESVPFTKATLDNLLGVQYSQESYRHYFDMFLLV